MRQLSGLDASFIYLDDARTPMHIGSVAIYDPSTAPGPITYKSILEHFERRMAAVPSARERLVRVPLDLDHPYWVRDPEFDLEFHIRQIALPKPGDWQQLCTQVARLHARPLDMTRPLWEYYVIEGLDSIPGVPRGSIALYSKAHHAGIDGASGAEMAEVIHDLTPEPGDVVPVSTESDPVPGQIELLARAGVNWTLQPFRFARLARRTLRRTLTNVGALRDTTTPAPRTRFSAAVTPHRVVDGRSFSLVDVKEIRHAVPGATVNDAILAVVAGALREYLDGHGELPRESLHAMAPISVRTDDEAGTLGNRVSAMRVELPTTIADPIARLAQVRETTKKTKEITEAIGARTLSDYTQFVPWQLAGVASRVAARTNMASRAAMPVNTVVTNVPGPQFPLYLAGAKMVKSFGLGILTDGVGIFHTVFSYDGQISLTVIACRELMPDPERYAECMQTSFDDLLAAVRAQQPQKLQKAQKAPAAKPRRVAVSA